MAKIELEKAYNAKTVEDKIYQKWEESGYFNPDNLPSDQQENFVISMPPPNVTGILHLGHAFENALMDIQIRYQRLQGKRAVIIPGTDHAAVATQARVEGELKKQGMINPRQELGRDGLVEKIREFSENHKSIMIGQIKKMGTSCDWSRLAYTFDEPRSLAVNEIFRRMFADGLIYRGYRVINWSVKGQSTCSDDELEYETKKTTVYTFKYSQDFPIAIATTRPETKLGDTAVAINPDDERYRHLIGQKFTIDVGAENPLVITIIADKNVDMNYGTGAVGVTPAHSQIDFEMYQNNKEIGIIPVIGKDGCMLKSAGKNYEGLTTLEAREKFVAWLKEKKLYISEEEIEHNVGISDRFRDVVEALPMDQWFVDVNKIIPGRNKSLKQLMREAVTIGHQGDKNKLIKITPERFEGIYLSWIDNLRDWCISRQIWWGHRIPVWYCDDCGEIFYDDKNPETCLKCHSKNIRQDEDTLDTWFSSGAWTFSTLGWPGNSEDLKKFHPTTWMQMGYEILFFWMARMILMTTYILDDIPFKNVYIHGILRAKDGRKFSKSLGNGLDPLEVIEKYGTDALRLSLIKGVTAGNDSRFYEEKIEGARNFVNKLWNISRYIFSTIAEPKIISIQPDAVSLADRWILSRLSAVSSHVGAQLESADFSGASDSLTEFTWNDFADWYLEVAKIETGKEEILLYVLQNLLRLWHPFIPFVTEEIWSKFEGAGLLMVETWPRETNAVITQGRSSIMGKIKQALHLNNQNNYIEEFGLIKEIIIGLRNLRAENKVDAGKWAQAIIFAGAKKVLLEGQKEIIMKLARLEKLEISEAGDKPKGSAASMIGGVEVYLDLAGLIDVDSEKERLGKELETVEKYAKGIKIKLGNEEFVKNAPSAVVEGERLKLAEAQEKIDKLKTQLDSLGQSRGHPELAKDPIFKYGDRRSRCGDSKFINFYYMALKKQKSVITDEARVEEVLTRGVENVYPDKATLKKALMSGRRLRLYCGFDPTATSLHIGHGIQIKKLEEFRRLGHEVIFLYGGFTAMVGDPTDKAQARKALTATQVKKNAMGWKAQIKNIINVKKIVFKNNHNWLAKLKFADILQLTSYFTAQQMLARDMFQKRMEEGKDLYLNEFMYPLMQAYDSVAMDVDLEIGGNDQMFNMLAGRTLMKKMKNKEKFVLTTKLLADPTGKKMGKTEGNMISLSDSPEEMFGKVMSWTDGMIVPALEIITDLPLELVAQVEEKLKNSALNPRDAKLDLAYEVVKVYLGEVAAEKGRANFKRVFQEKDKPLEIPEVKISGADKIGVLDLFSQAGLTSSNGEARRLITEKALKIDDALVTSVDLKIEITDQGLLLQRGKKQFTKVIK